MTAPLWPVVVAVLATTPVAVAVALCLVLRARPDASITDAAYALEMVIRAIVHKNNRE